MYLVKLRLIHQMVVFAPLLSPLPTAPRRRLRRPQGPLHHTGHRHNLAGQVSAACCTFYAPIVSTGYIVALCEGLPRSGRKPNSCNWVGAGK